MISNFDEICRDSYEQVYLDEWGKADAQDKEQHRTLVAAVFYAQAWQLEGGAA